MIIVGHYIHIIYDYSIKVNYYNYMQYYNIFMIIHYRNMHDYMDVKLDENQNLLRYMGCTTKMVMNFINMTLFHFFFILFLVNKCYHFSNVKNASFSYGVSFKLGITYNLIGKNMNILYKFPFPN